MAVPLSGFAVVVAPFFVSTSAVRTGSCHGYAQDGSEKKSCNFHSQIPFGGESGAPSPFGTQVVCGLTIGED